MPPSRPEGEDGEDGEDDGEPKAPPIEPDFGVSGLLAAETNTVNGVTLVYAEPLEAKKPTVRWRLYVFKNGKGLVQRVIHSLVYYLDFTGASPWHARARALLTFVARLVA